MSQTNQETKPVMSVATFERIQRQLREEGDAVIENSHFGADSNAGPADMVDCVQSIARDNAKHVTIEQGVVELNDGSEHTGAYLHMYVAGGFSHQTIAVAENGRVDVID